MLSKCLNSHCSATFKYLGRGRLFGIDFTGADRRNTLAGERIVASIHSKAYPIEHFWLCETCAASMTIELSDTGEVRVVPFAVRNSITAPAPQTEMMYAARHF